MRSTFARFAALPAAVALLAAVWVMPAFAAPAALSPGQFVVVNNTSFTIASLFVAPSDSNTWGDDLLAGQVLNASQNGTVSLYSYDGSTCLYDVAVVGTEGQKGSIFRFDLCNLDTVTFSDV